MVTIILKLKSFRFKVLKNEHMHNLKKVFSLILVMIFSVTVTKSQVSVIGVQLQHFNVTPTSLLQASIMNAGTEQQVIIESKLFNAGGEMLMSSRSAAFALHPGLNIATDRSVANVEYGSGNQSTYIKTSHILPGGRFKICVNIISATNSEVIEDYCDEVESDLTQFLYLVNPPDKDVIPNPNPVLVWTHSEPFSILGQGEYFRMIVVELSNAQSPEEGIVSNTPLFIRNYLTSHELLYPADAKILQVGHRYGWQVQKMSNDIVINKSEAWEFTLAANKTVTENQYAVLQKTLDAGYYTAINNSVFFRFNEEYSAGTVSCIIYDSKRQPVKPKVESEGISKAYNVKQNGQNRYEINLDKLNMSSGYYTLQVKTEKGETFMLKFLVD